MRCFHCPKAIADKDFISSWGLGFCSLQRNMWVKKKKRDKNKWVRNICLLFKLCSSSVLKWYWELVIEIHFVARMVCFTSLDTCLSWAIQNNFICKRSGCCLTGRETQGREAPERFTSFALEWQKYLCLMLWH